MAAGAPANYIADLQASIRLQLLEQIAAYNRELAMSSTIAGSAKEARLIFDRDAMQFRADRIQAFLIHYHAL